MRLLRSLFLVLGLVVLVDVNDSQAAGSGVISLEIPDAAAVGKGSAFTGEANRPSAVYYNPAGITQIGTQASIGLTALSPQLDYESVSTGTVQERRKSFIFPHVYFTTPIVQDRFYFGLGENSNWGAGHEWAADSPPTFTRYSMVKDSIENKDYMLVGSYKFNDHWSFAIGADNDDSKLNKEQKIFQDGGPSDLNVQLKAKDNAWGYRVATLYKVNEQHQFGLMYRSRINHEYEGKIYIDNLNDNTGATGSAPYQTLFGGRTSYETRVTQKLTLPQSVVLGYSFKPTNRWTLNLDLEWLDWSSIKQQANNYPDETNSTILSILNTGNPHSRDWKSVWSQSVGAEYAVNERFRIRGGYVHHQTPIGNDTFDTTFEDSNSHSITTGIGYDLTKNLTVDVAYVAVLYEPRKINNNMDSGFGANLSGTYKQFINIGTATLTYKF